MKGVEGEEAENVLEYAAPFKELHTDSIENLFLLKVFLPPFWCQFCGLSNMLLTLLIW